MFSEKDAEYHQHEMSLSDKYPIRWFHLTQFDQETVGLGWGKSTVITPETTGSFVAFLQRQKIRFRPV